MRYKKQKTSDEAWLEFCVDKTLEEITEHFKVAKSSARTRCSMLGIKIRKDKNGKYPGIEEYAKTHTIRECALFYNSNYSTIVQYIRAHDIKYKPELTTKGIERVVTKRTGIAQDMIITLCDSYSMASIAKVFGYTKERVRQIYHEAKQKERKIQKLTTKELRKLLNNYSGGQLFNKTEEQMRKYIRYNFICSEYTVRTLAKEFCNPR